MTETADGRAERGAPLLTLVLDGLDARLAGLKEEEPVLRAFAGWIRGITNDTSGVLRSLGQEAASRQGAARHYRDVAVLGFASARLGEDPLAPDILLRFQEGVAWLRGRRFYVENQPLGFEADAIAIMGVATGMCAGSLVSQDVAWLKDIITQSRRALAEVPWTDALLQGAGFVLDRCTDGVPRAMEPSTSIAHDLAAALASLGIAILTEQEELRALTEIVRPEYREVPIDRAIVQLAALKWLMRRGAVALPRRATLSDVLEILKGIPHALKRWPWEEKPRTKAGDGMPQRWDFQNEYHVQSLLWAVLAPTFPDLKDEEYLRAIGHKHPRVDLAIPSLRLIIEVKYLRGGAQNDLASVIEDVAADTGLYLSTPADFTTIIAFVWDNVGSSDQHETLLSGLRKLRGVSDAVVVSRPGRFEAHEAP